MYSYTIGSSGAMEIKVCITVLNVQHMEDKPRTCLLINFIFLFFFSSQLLPHPLSRRQPSVLKIIVQAGSSLRCYSCRYTIHTWTTSQHWACVFVYIAMEIFLFLTLYMYTHISVYILSIHSGWGICRYLRHIGWNKRSTEISETV